MDKLNNWRKTTVLEWIRIVTVILKKQSQTTQETPKKWAWFRSLSTQRGLESTAPTPSSSQTQFSLNGNLARTIPPQRSVSTRVETTRSSSLTKKNPNLSRVERKKASMIYSFRWFRLCRTRKMESSVVMFQKTVLLTTLTKTQNSESSYWRIIMMH